METQAPSAPKPQPTPWYRQRSLQLIAATLVFLSPLLALPIAWSQAPASQPLALRGQPVLRLQALSSGAATLLYGQTPGNLWRSVDDGVTWTRADNGLPAAGLGASLLLDWAVASADPWTLYALARSNGEVRLFQSSDGGDTWRAGGRWPAAGETFASFQAYTLALSADDAQWIYLAERDAALAQQRRRAVLAALWPPARRRARRGPPAAGRGRRAACHPLHLDWDQRLAQPESGAELAAGRRPAPVGRDRQPGHRPGAQRPGLCRRPRRGLSQLRRRRALDSRRAARRGGAGTHPVGGPAGGRDSVCVGRAQPTLSLRRRRAEAGRRSAASAANC